MHLDMATISVVAIMITTVLGLVLCFNWARQGGSIFVGMWGLAMILLAAGIVLANVSGRTGLPNVLVIGQAMMVLAAGVKWHACREFAHRNATHLYTFAGSIVFLAAAYSGSVDTFNSRLMLVCVLAAAYNLAAAIELAYANGEQLPSRWSGVLLLALTSASFLSWLPLIVIRPIPEVGTVFVSSWFPAVILATLLLRTALAFVVLSMAKERQELEQRYDALTDSLTGLPNRRALFEAADMIAQRRILGGTPVSLLIFDLDRFKDTNDGFGHTLGDEVLKIFAATAATKLKVNAIIGRLGGEEFAAILPGLEAEPAVEAAERVRSAFFRTAAFVNGLAVGATVSVGVASDTEVDADLSALFRRADAALYVAKRRGRNQVALLGPDDDMVLPGVRSTVRTSPTRLRGTAPVLRRDSLRTT